MAGLSELRLPTKTITTSGGDIIVRGVSLSDITDLLQEHAEGMSEAFEKVTDMTAGKKITTHDTLKIMREVANTAPLLLAALIAQAADEPGLSGIAGKLPFPDQVKLLEAIFFLTFTSEEEVGNLVEVVVRAVTGVNNLRVVALSSKD